MATASRHAPAAMRDLLGVAAVPRAARRRPLHPRRRPPVGPQTPALTRSAQVRRDRAEQLVERRTLRAGPTRDGGSEGPKSGRPWWRSGASVGAQKPALWRIGRTLPEFRRSRPVGAVLRCGHFGGRVQPRSATAAGDVELDGDTQALVGLVVAEIRATANTGRGASLTPPGFHDETPSSEQPHGGCGWSAARRRAVA